MFEHYLQHQAPDNRRRWRVALALNVAGFATLSMVGFTWFADKMMIARVDAPTAHYVMVQMDVEALPPPPAPPAAPAVKEEPVDEHIPDEDPVQPETFSEIIPPKPKIARVTGTGVPTSTGTSPIGNKLGIPGIPGGIPTLTGIGQAPPIAISRDRPQTDTRPPLPISAVMAQAIYTPPPDKNRLAATKAAMFDKRPGANETSFCIDTEGRTVDVRTTRKFPGDPKIDEICRETVKSWRFKSFKVDGRPVKTCSIQVFNISFKD